MASALKFIVLSVLLGCVQLCTSADRPEYVKPCYSNDTKLVSCFVDSIVHLGPYLARGIPELHLPTIEPFRLDEMSLALTSGPQGYKITLRDMDIFGVSNFQVKKLKLSKKGAPFEAHIRMPKLTMTADYKSSGVLLILPASGSGIFNNTMKDVNSIVKGTVSFHERDGKEYMLVDTLDFDLDCKEISMRVDKAFPNAPILRQATNLFLRENGLEVLQEMKPQMNSKLGEKFKQIVNTMLKYTPVDLFYIQE